MRFVAAFGIVWAHVQAPFAAEGYVALALFLVLTGFLSVQSLARGGVRRFWLGRLIRFFLPWLVWSAVFLGIAVLRGGWVQVLSFPPLWLLIGPSIHLWFLPFIILTSPLVILVHKRLTNPNRVWLAAICAVPVAVWAVWAHDAAVLPEPLAQWAFATMPLLYGLLSAIGQQYRATAAAMVFAVFTCSVSYFWFGSPVAPFLFFAAIVFEGLWRIDLQSPRMASLGTLAFGIYLMHPFFMLVWYHFGGADQSKVAAAVAIFAASACGTALLRLVPAGRIVA